MVNDPYKFFRVEARELLDGLSRGVLELERGVPAASTASTLLRLAHTLKGAARVVRQPGLAELSHGLEELLVPYREATEAIPGPMCAQLLQLIDEMEAQLSALADPSTPGQERPSGSAAASAFPVGEPGGQTSEAYNQVLRVAVDDVDAILDSLDRTSISVDFLKKAVRQLVDELRRPTATQRTVPERLPFRSEAGLLEDRPAHSLAPANLAEIQDIIERVGSEISLAVHAIRDLRLVKVSTIFPSLERALRDATQSAGKRGQLVLSGGDVHLDANILGEMRDALVQLIRNAVAHGLETAPARAAAGKSTEGVVRLSVERRGHRVLFSCQDDGAGLDIAAINRIARLRAATQGNEALAELDMAGAIDLVFKGGLTTAAAATELSGRGVGLDLVRTIVTRTKGELSASSTPGQGTRIDIEVPVSLASVHVQLLEIGGGRTVLVPTDCVQRAVLLPEATLLRSERGLSLPFEGEALPFADLSALLKGRHSPSRVALVVKHAGVRVSVGAQRLLGSSVIFMRAIPPEAGRCPWVAGASLDEEGTPLLVLDPAGLVAEIAGRTSPVAPPLNPGKIKVLVIDDSLTTRMLEKTILETAGYDVTLATSGEEGLTMAKEKPYEIFIVDVEMPGIDGYEFLRRVRADAGLRDIPAIMVTSRAATDDRQRGADAGAQDYLIKSEFDEARFLRRIRELVGR